MHLYQIQNALNFTFWSHILTLGTSRRDDMLSEQVGK